MGGGGGEGGGHNFEFGMSNRSFYSRLRSCQAFD